MEENLIKPDVMIVTKNVMVPRTVPAPMNKLFHSPSVSRKKTKIIKPRKSKDMTKLPSLNVEVLNYLHKENNWEMKQKIICDTVNLDYNCDSLHSLDQEVKDNYKNPCSETCITKDSHFHNFTEAKTNKKMYLSESFHEHLMPPSMNNDSNLDCQRISLSENSTFFTSDSNHEIEDQMIDEELLFKRSLENDSATELTELRCCVSNNISSNISENIENSPVKVTAADGCDVKYSWQDLENWIPPSRKKNINLNNNQAEVSNDRELDCKIKYSWQVIGTGAQTSLELLQSFVVKDESLKLDGNERTNYPCSVKYSWQIIGTSTQVAFPNGTNDSFESDKDYWDGKIISSGKRSAERRDNRVKGEECLETGKRKILYNESTQTFADKAQQTELTNCRVKYSWQNLTKQYLDASKQL